MSEVEIGGLKYRIGKLDARRQFHVARRLVPIMGALASAMSGSTANLAQALGPIADAVAAMPDADADYVVSAMLSTVEREVPGGAAWAKIQAPNGVLMFADIDLGQMLQLVAAGIQENLGGFFSEIASASEAIGPKA